MLSLFNISSANQRATLSCISFCAGNDALNSQPRALELSVRAKILCGPGESVMVRWMEIAEAMNSSKFIVKQPCMFFGNWYRHALPSDVKPPNPVSHASDITVTVGDVKVMELMSMPLLDVRWRRVIHSIMSSRTCAGIVWTPFDLHTFSKCRILFIKYLP